MEVMKPTEGVSKLLGVEFHFGGSLMHCKRGGHRIKVEALIDLGCFRSWFERA